MRLLARSFQEHIDGFQEGFLLCCRQRLDSIHPSQDFEARVLPAGLLIGESQDPIGLNFQGPRKPDEHLRVQAELVAFVV